MTDEIKIPAPDALRVAWNSCPECGSSEIAHEEGDHKQCAGCGQEWFSDINYSSVVQKNLARLYIRSDALRRAVGALEKIKLQSEDCLGQRMETITAIADQVLTALQAEQGAK